MLLQIWETERFSKRTHLNKVQRPVSDLLGVDDRGVPAVELWLVEVPLLLLHRLEVLHGLHQLGLIFGVVVLERVEENDLFQ